MSILPFASYSAPDIQKSFTVDTANPRYQSTDGSTTGPSPHVLNAGQIDRDKPAPPRTNPDGQITALGSLRAQLTGLQDDINHFLTDRMEQAKRKRARVQSDEQKNSVEHK